MKSETVYLIKVILLIIFLFITIYLIKNIKNESFDLDNNNTFIDDKMNIFYINLDRNPERREYMEKQFKKHNLIVKRYSAFDKKLLNINKLYELQKTKFIECAETIKKRKKEGSLACLMSHVKVWEKNYNDNNINYVLIFEDDCKILPNFKNKLKTALDNAPDNWDMIWLGYNKVKGDKISDFFYRPYKGRNIGYNSQHHCYLVKRKSIPKMISIITPVKQTSGTKDMTLKTNFDKFNAYFYKEKLAVQDVEKFSKSERTGGKNG